MADRVGYRVQGQSKRNKCIGARDGDRRTATGTQGKGQVQEKNGLEHTLGQMDMDRRSGTVTYRQEIGTQTERHMFCHHWYLNFGRRDFCKKYANTPLDNLIFHVVSLFGSRSCVNCTSIVGWCKTGGVCRNR